MNGRILLYKSGTEGFANSGLEPYSEYYASQIAKAMELRYVEYGLSPALTSKFLILSIFHDLLICNYYLIKSTLFLVYNTPFILLSLKKLLLTLISMTSGVIILVGYFPSYLEGAIDIPYVFGTQNFISKCLFYFIS